MTTTATRLEDKWNIEQVAILYRRPLALRALKRCGACAEPYWATTPDAVLSLDGLIYFHCQCGGTLTVKPDCVLWTSSEEPKPRSTP